jgi:hypothetical protein
MTDYLLIYDLPIGTPIERYTRIGEALDKINAVKVAYSTFHVSYAGDLSAYLAPLFTSDDRVIIAPYNPYATQMQKGREPSDGLVPYQPMSLGAPGLANLGLLAGLLNPEPEPVNALLSYGNGQPRRPSLWD